MRHPVQQPLGAPGTRREDHLRRGDRTARLAKPGPCRLGRDAVSGFSTVIVERLDANNGAQRLYRGSEALGQGEVVLDQGVLGSDPAADHTVAALRAACARGTVAAEVRVGDPLTRLAEEDADGRLAEGFAHPQVISRLAHDLLDRALAGVRDHAQHPRGSHVVRRELGLPVGDVGPLLVLEERRRRDVKGVRVVEAAPADSGTGQDHHVGQAVDPLDPKQLQPRSPQVATQVPGGLGKVLIGNPAAGLDDVDAIALTRQPKCRNRATEPRADHHHVVVVSAAVHLAVVHRAHRTPNLFIAPSATVRVLAHRWSESPNGAANPMTCWAVMFWVSVYLVIPSAPWRRDTPELFMPPIGAPTLPQAAAY